MKIALITCNIGNFDNIIDPVKQSIEYDYYSYNENNLPFPLPNLNKRLQSKYIKTQMHRYLPGYDVYIYIDGRINVVHERFIKISLNRLLDNDIVIIKHPERSSVFEELEFIIKKIVEGNEYLSSRYKDQKMDKELDFYKSNKKDFEDIPLFMSGIIIRSNTKLINECFDEWWRKTIEFSYFDQAMLSYVLGKYKLKINISDKDFLFDFYLHLDKHIMPTINCTSELVLEDIKYHLSKFRSLAVLRYGDGEAMVLDKEGGIEDKNFIFKRQLGYIPSDKEREDIVHNLVLAYNNCDTIGVPTEKHEDKGAYWAKAIPILKSYGVMDNVQTFCSINLHYDLLNGDKYKELLMDLDDFYYISCRNIDNELKKKFNIKNVHSFQIAPEMKFTSGYEGDKHYPTQFDQIKIWMKGLGECNGKLMFIGAGVVGKLYAIWFKQQGGVSLDIGSIFDYWAGKNTRGPERKLDAADLEFKL